MTEQFLIYFSSLNILVNIFLIWIIIFLIKTFISCLKLKDYPEITNNSIDEDDYKLYNEYAKEVDKRILSNVENFDKNILTISTFLLGLSLIFIKDIVGDETPKNIEYIHSSWTYLLVSIAMTITSFIVGWKDNEISLNHFYKFLIEKRGNYEDKKSIYSYILEYSTYMSAIFLFLGMLYLYLFVKINF